MNSGIPIGRDALMEQLTRSITGGDFSPGDKLPSERQLSVQYSVSRPVVREALQRLRERGLIHIAPGSGAYLRQTSAIDWARPLDAAARQRSVTSRQLVEARVMLEDRSASLAAERATPEDIDSMEKALAAFDDARNVLERARCDIVFHTLVAKASHNPVIEMMFGAIAPLVFEVMLRSLDDPNVVAAGAPLHHDILDAIRSGDPSAAREAAIQHISLAATLFGDDYDEPLDTMARRKIDSLFGEGVDLESVIDSALNGG